MKKCGTSCLAPCPSRAEHSLQSLQADGHTAVAHLLWERRLVPASQRHTGQRQMDQERSSLPHPPQGQSFCLIWMAGRMDRRVDGEAEVTEVCWRGRGSERKLNSSVTAH